VIGDGINVAQRVMSFAHPNQILVSRSYHEVVSRLSQEYAQLFHYAGLHRDKHVREHEVYEVHLAPSPGGGPRLPGRPLSRQPPPTGRGRPLESVSTARSWAGWPLPWLGRSDRSPRWSCGGRPSALITGRRSSPRSATAFRRRRAPDS